MDEKIKSQIQRRLNKIRELQISLDEAYYLLEIDKGNPFVVGFHHERIEELISEIDFYVYCAPGGIER